ncbi:hypothetical protein DPEC_G00334720 [Dallia pectoralis]|uniref:Uncharacterized protein n=1 Tax=Dallia pectoralis TaxID=75939 RepID=A0ACC2F6S0_DALPE|nr:hypothetical protein DPEC_G00334720 [Dallia pectoralis]
MHLNFLLFSLGLIIITALSLSLTTAEDMQGFCFWTKVTLNRETHVGFLLRHDTEPSHGSSTSLHLYHSVWSVENTPLKCVVTGDTGITDNYAFWCREKSIAGDFSGSPDERFDFSLLFGPESPCALRSPNVPKRAGAASEEPNDKRLETHRNRRRGRSVVDEYADYFGPSANQNPDRGDSSGTLTHAHRRVRRGFIVPGTLWCGAGNKALSYDDLGVFAQTDICCREHDQCQDIILSFETNYGVFNKNIFTLSHCDCDNRFRACLLGAEDRMSDVVGYSFFNVLQMPCFQFTQTLQCSRRSWFGMCETYAMSLYAEVYPATAYNSTLLELDRDQEDQQVDNITISSSTPPSSTPPSSTPPSSTTPSSTTPSSTTPSSTPPSSSTPSSTTPSSTTPSSTPPSSTPPSSTPASSTPASSTTPSSTTPSSTTPSSTLNTVPATSDHSSVSTPVTLAPPTRVRLASAAEPIQQNQPTQHLSEEDKDTADRRVCVCDVYRQLDDCPFKIPPHQERYGLINPESRSLYHCNCTSRLSDGLVQQKQWSLILVEYISPSCFTLQPPDCTPRTTSCLASLVQRPPTQPETLHSTGGDLGRSSRGPNSRRAKRKYHSVRLHKRCLRMTPPKAHKTRKHKNRRPNVM